MTRLFSEQSIAYDIQKNTYHLADFTDEDIAIYQDKVFLIHNPDSNHSVYAALVFENNSVYMYEITKSLYKGQELKYKLINGGEFLHHKWTQTDHICKQEIDESVFDKIYRKKTEDLKPSIVPREITPKSPQEMLALCGDTGKKVIAVLDRLEAGIKDQSGFYGFFKSLYWLGAKTKQAQILDTISTLNPKNESELIAALEPKQSLFEAINAKRHCLPFNLHRYFFYENRSQSMSEIKNSCSMK